MIVVRPLKDGSPRHRVRYETPAFPELVDLYIKIQEDEKDKATTVSRANTDDIRGVLIDQVKLAAADLAAKTDLYDKPWTSFDEARAAVTTFKHYVEHQDGATSQALDRLASDIRDQLEILVEVQHNETGELRDGGNHQMRDGWRSVLALIGQEQLHLEGSVLDRGSEVLNRHRGQRRSGKRQSGFPARPR